nr:hypothetical protein [uncultured Acinetobacter sp.]
MSTLIINSKPEPIAATLIGYFKYDSDCAFADVALVLIHHCKTPHQYLDYSPHS